MSLDKIKPKIGNYHFLIGLMIAIAALSLSQIARAAGGDYQHHHLNHNHEHHRPDNRRVIPFFGEHQAGIATPMQQNTYFIAFDMVSTSRDDLIKLLKAWTDISAEMTKGPSEFNSAESIDEPSMQSGAAVDIPASNLTITFGFGRTLFIKDGVDRYGISKSLPEALVEMPRFAGDQLDPERTGGDLSIQASADDPQVVEYAVRRLARATKDIAVMRWAQMGFAGSFPHSMTGRNQMGFKDGTMNVPTDNPEAMNKFVWVGSEGPAWLRGGSYMVIRPIRIALDHWDDMKVSFQEETVGRNKINGAPIGEQNEHDPLGLDRIDKDGNPVINENSHAAMAAPENNGGAQILRRAFNYDNGIAKIAERWPPWRQLMTFDSGLLFQSYQKDPRTGFIKIFTEMAKVDMLNQFTTHLGSGLFACPSGVNKGEFIGQKLFD